LLADWTPKIAAGTRFCETLGIVAQTHQGYAVNIERLPVENAVTEQVRRSKSIKR
jgi:hypothetical protein